MTTEREWASQTPGAHMTRDDGDTTRPDVRSPPLVRAFFLVTFFFTFTYCICVVFVVVDVTRKNTPYRGVTVRWGRPLTALLPFTLLYMYLHMLCRRRCRRLVRLDALRLLFFSRRDSTCRRPRRRRLRRRRCHT